MSKKQKIILIVLFLIVVVVAVVLFFMRGDEVNDVVIPDEESDVVGNLPDVEGGLSTSTIESEDVLVKISDSDSLVFDFWENPDTGEILYMTESGNIISAKEGPDLEISSRAITAINKIVANEEGEVLVSFGDPNNPDWGLFDSDDSVWRPLPSYIKDITWGEDGSVVSVIRSEEGNSLVVFNLESLKSEGDDSYDILVRNFNLKDVNIEMVSPGSLWISEKISSDYPSRIWSLDMNDREFIQINSGEKGSLLKISGDTVFKWDGSKNRFFVLNKDGMNIKAPVLFNTLPYKCELGDNNIYCFVPYSKFPHKGSSVPDDYIKNKIMTNDVLIMIPGDNGEDKTLIDINEIAIGLDVREVKYIGEYLYFVNKYDGGLYRLKLDN